MFRNKSDDHVIVTATNLNSTYLHFVPSVLTMWKQYNFRVHLALLLPSDITETPNDLISELQQYCTLHVVYAVPDIPEGNQARAIRAWLACTLTQSVVTIVDVDQYVFHPEIFANHVHDARAGRLVAISHNGYEHTRDAGNFAMSFTTALSSTYGELMGVLHSSSWPQFVNKFRRVEEPLNGKEHMG